MLEGELADSFRPRLVGATFAGALLLAVAYLSYTSSSSAGSMVFLPDAALHTTGSVVTQEPPVVVCPPAVAPETPSPSTDGPGWNFAIVTFLSVELYGEYGEEASSMACYASLHGYPFYLEPLRRSSHNHGWFARWPLVMKHLANFDWIYAMDADVIVLNYSKRLADYLPRNRDTTLSLLLQDRENGEVNAGAVWLRNTDWTRNFMERWMAYPDSTVNGDNGALLHMVLLERGVEDCHHDGDYNYQIQCFRSRLNPHSTWPWTPQIFIYRAAMGYFREYERGLDPNDPRAFYFHSRVPGDFIGMGKKFHAEITEEEIKCEMSVAQYTGYTGGVEPDTSKRRAYMCGYAYNMFGGDGGPADRSYNCTGRYEKLEEQPWPQ